MEHPKHPARYLELGIKGFQHDTLLFLVLGRAAACGLFEEMGALCESARGRPCHPIRAKPCQSFQTY